VRIVRKLRLTGTIVLVGVLAQLTGCVATIGAGAATGAAIATDRRTAGTFVDDELIELKSLRALSESESLWEQSHINVTSYNNIVLLSGEAPTAELKADAAAIVRPIAKVREVHNEIVVAAPSSLMSRSSDTVVTGKVKSKMLATKEFPSTRVKVVTENGTVFLLGLVTRQEAETATEITRAVGGVQRVIRLFEYLD